MKYIITIWQKEIHKYTFEVESETEHDAIELAFEGTGTLIKTELDNIQDSGLIEIKEK
jgi:hypothetical protein